MKEQKDKKNFLYRDCLMDKRLEIMYDEYKNNVMLSRCCYTYPFISLSIKEFLKLDDIIKFSCGDFNHKIKNEVCACPCEIKPEIKVVTVGLSRACNLYCYHCFFKEHKDTPEMKELYFHTLERIKGHHLDVIHMQSSGEIFYYYHHLKCYLNSLTTKDTLQVNFQTNGNLLSAERLKELKEISKKTGIQYTFSFSMDAITSETYKKVRCGGDFDKLLDILERTIILFGKENIDLSFTIKEPNMHEASKFRKFYRDEYGITRAYLSYDFFDKKCQDLYNSLPQEGIC